MCYDRLAVKRFAAYDAATLHPFLSRMLITWYAMFPVPALRSGAVILMGRERAADLQPRKWVGGAPASDSDEVPPISD